MFSSDITMSQRSLPLAYMISAGNQAILALEDFIDALCEEDEVRAIGLHIEGLKDVPAFVRAAQKALDAGKPIVALKTGSSKVGARLTESHTGSLSGTDELYSALFDKLAIIRVQLLVQDQKAVDLTARQHFILRNARIHLFDMLLHRVVDMGMRGQFLIGSIGDVVAFRPVAHGR